MKYLIKPAILFVNNEINNRKYLEEKTVSKLFLRIVLASKSCNFEIAFN